LAREGKSDRRLEKTANVKLHIVNMGQLLALFYVIKIFIYIK